MKKRKEERSDKKEKERSLRVQPSSAVNETERERQREREREREREMEGKDDIAIVEAHANTFLAKLAHCCCLPETPTTRTFGKINRIQEKPTLR